MSKDKSFTDKCLEFLISKEIIYVDKVSHISKSLRLNDQKSSLAVPEATISYSDKGIPIYLFNEHQWALYSWLHAQEKRIITAGATLLHVDSHDDLAACSFSISKLSSEDVALYLKTGHLFSRAEKCYLGKNEHPDPTIWCGNFIEPAINSGLIKDYLWIAPPWNRSSFGKAIRSGSIPEMGKPLILDIDLDYFVSTDHQRDPLHSMADMEEIKRTLDSRIKGLFVDLYSANIKPDLITIAESDQDNEYTPDYLVDYIRNGVIERISRMCIK